MTAQLEILSNSESERMKIWQNTIKSLFFTEKFNVIFDLVDSWYIAKILQKSITLKTFKRILHIIKYEGFFNLNAIP